MCRIVQIYSLCMWSASLILLVAGNPLKLRCNYVHNNTEFIEYWCFNIPSEMLVRVEVIPEKQFKIICQGFNDSAYIDYITDIKTTRQFKRLFIKQCPLPNISFRKLLDKLSIDSINEIHFESYRNISDQLKPFYFENLPKVERIDFSSNGISNLEESLFTDVTKLKVLNLRDNEISHIPTKLFKWTNHLEWLDIGMNKLNKLDAGIFKYIPELKTLNLYGNELENIPDIIFTKCRNLTALNVSFNDIKTFNQTFCDNTTTLQYLDISYNDAVDNLHELCPDGFACKNVISVPRRKL